MKGNYTHEWFVPFCKFVELWERALAGTLSYDVSKALGPNEESVNPFYENLKMNILKLTNNLLERKKPR